MTTLKQPCPSFSSPCIFAAGEMDAVPIKMLGMPLVVRALERLYSGPACRRQVRNASLALLFFAFSLGALAQGADAAQYAAGEKLFKGNCASCHKPDKDLTGPALAGARARWEGKGDIHAWVKNSSAYLKTGNPYATELYAKWNKGVMTAQSLTDEEIDAILYYADNYAPPAPKEPVTPETASNGATDTGSNWPWLVVIALLLAVVGVSLSGVKSSLTNAVREAEGQEPLPDMTTGQKLRQWAWNNKGFATIIALFVVTFITLKLWDAAWVIGVYGGDEVEHYKPEQPINFPHSLHAGKVEVGNLAIDCQYCHSSAAKSKHAGIPTTNVCMNCHTAVSEGRSPEGTAEIQKIYAAAGWDPAALKYTGKIEPVKWVKVHNLPDHAYFNHSQHVKVGQIECQECHGPIDEKMGVAEQWAPLTMGWCIDCHNTKDVKMAGNGYYDEIMARLEETDMGHAELKKYLEDDKISVRELGGWECAKCHY
ncbi:MAG: c-type cytochrome [Flavobacteriales bacterium]|nr:c-type cytochrome [Flavobacteriales bacterium]MBP7156132.1 c-type cytochrome [Flavobacteriales bacterium]